MTPPIESFKDALNIDPTVNRMVRQDFNDTTGLIVALAREKQLLMERIIELESICPKKFRGTNCAILIWHCPNDLIPCIDLPPS